MLTSSAYSQHESKSWYGHLIEREKTALAQVLLMAEKEMGSLQVNLPQFVFLMLRQPYEQ